MKAVTYYTHEASDSAHSTQDQLAFVLAESEEAGWVDLVIFPVGGPVKFGRAWAWDDDAPVAPPGGSYWREDGSDAPDFAKAYRHYDKPEFRRLLADQQQDYARTPTKDHDGLRDKHKEAQDKLMSELDGNEKPEAKKPEDEPKPQGNPEQDNFGAATDMGRRDA